MRQKLPWILFAASALVNVFLVAGMLYGLYGADNRDEAKGNAVELTAEQLDLTEAQRAALIALRERIHARRDEMRGGRDETRAAMLAEIAKPEFDREAFLAVVDARDAERQAFLADVAAEMHAFLASLSPPQREEFLAMAREPDFLRKLFSRPRRAEAKS